MSLKQNITSDMKTAMRAKDMASVTTLRTLLSEVKNFEIDSGARDEGASDDDVQKVASRMMKQVKEAAEEYAKGDRADLVAEEKAKAEILEKYLPRQMSDDDLKTIVEKVVADTSDTSSLGPIIGAVMKEVQGQADGKRVSSMVAQVIANS